MKERKKRILKFMSEKNYVPLLFEELVSVLDVPPSDVDQLKELLDSLISSHKVVLTRRGRYMISDEEEYVKGMLKNSGRGYGFVISEDSDLDLFVSASHFNHAMNGDIVLAKVTKPALGGHRAEGEIDKIIEHSNQKVVGTLSKVKDYGFVIPDDYRQETDVHVSAENFGGAVDGQKVVVEIIKWPGETEKRARGKKIIIKKPEGKIVEVLGYPDEKGVDVFAVIRSHGIRVEFPETVLIEAAKVPEKVEDKALQQELTSGRRDLRDIITITIDGDDAKDLDDAVSVERLDDGGYRLGVHIADVSYYVPEDGDCDQEARIRGTSVYFVDRVVPMLPKHLSNGICSLNPKVDRLTFSCMMNYDKTGKQTSHEIFTSVIKTTERMTYHHVYQMLENDDHELCSRYKDILPMLKDMKELSILLREQRTGRGAIDFDFVETRVMVDENGKPTDIVPCERTIANDLIEDFMLAANETVAEHFYWLDLPFLYRIHELPDPDKVQVFATFASNLGYQLRNINNTVPGDFQAILKKAKGTDEEKVLSTVMLRSLQKARYSSDYDKHFGLAADYYSHFTSPIRRYPDLTIHRLMKEYLKGNYNKKRIMQLKERVADIAKASSMSEIIAQEAERDVEDIKKFEYMKQFVGDVFDGIISGVTNFGFFVELTNTVEGLVHINTLTDDYYIYTEERYELEGEHSHKKYKIGDYVKVILAKADESYKKLDFILVEVDENGEDIPVNLEKINKGYNRKSVKRNTVKTNVKKGAVKKKGHPAKDKKPRGSKKKKRK